MELRGNLRLENRVVDDLQSDDKTAGNNRSFVLGFEKRRETKRTSIAVFLWLLLMLLLLLCVVSLDQTESF